VVHVEAGDLKNLGSATPVYRRIANDLRASIDSQALAPGAQVPSETALMAQYGASRGTARQALALLEAAGLIDAVHGKGRFVHEQGTNPR
jgi:GntR family mannosyl-D-glycerate transport/metabolism transcriptional repressor